MVEMLEAQKALTYATENSLIIFDEIGRGTSTYDGLALAQAMIEYVAQTSHAKTLFSTHYHELTSLDQMLPCLKNVHVAANEYKGELIFLHKVKDGAVDDSYGIQVAKLADLPEEVINRAQIILDEFEQNLQVKSCLMNYLKIIMKVVFLLMKVIILLMPKTINSKMILNKPHLIYLKITINKVKLN